ncbi:laccase-2-like [Anopheles albimanus]|uniref:laccase-2-like n=1 Tax=Anopheles albimanus TaxID=7167 RepID=UPI00163F6E1D|nr:laccase-2-like [Anopheles albimanus]
MTNDRQSVVFNTAQGTARARHPGSYRKAMHLIHLSRCKLGWVSRLFRCALLFTVFRETASYGLPFSTKPASIWSELLWNNQSQDTLGSSTNRIVPGEQCDRPCIAGEQPLTCHFHWKLENFASMGSSCWNCSRGVRSHCFHPQCVTTDGTERGILTINRQLPGPMVHVCKHDTVVVDVENHLEGAGSTIHWHGFHQHATPWMDGVPMVTQCPIPQGTTFRYRFEAVEAGTQFYHSHAGFQKANGHYGMIVVRNPADLNQAQYDHDLSEHRIIIADWTRDLVEKWVPGIQSESMRIDSILINGRGRYFNATIGSRTEAPLTVYRVEYGQRYRFRLISSGSQYCPFQLQIQNHTMLVISTDGGTVQPEHSFDTLVSISGERYDFVLAANQPPGNYWVRVRSIGFCDPMRVEDFAILSYVMPETSVAEEGLTVEQTLAFPPNERMPAFDEPYPIGTILNHQTAPCYTPNDTYVCAADLESYEMFRDEKLIEAVPDRSFLLGFYVKRANNSLLFSDRGSGHFATVRDDFNTIGATNMISYEPPSFPLLIQPELIVDENAQFCNVSHKPAHCSDDKLCFCTHRLKVKHNDIVEIVLIDTAPVVQAFYHPFHLHGHRFIVTDTGRFPSNVTTDLFDYIRGLRTMRRPNAHNPPYKDTMSIPNRGFVKIRFRANNPGFWLVHCHFEWHLANGMALVLQIGEPEEMRKPPADFPRCGNYVPPINGV